MLHTASVSRRIPAPSIADLFITHRCNSVSCSSVFLFPLSAMLRVIVSYFAAKLELYTKSETFPDSPFDASGSWIEATCVNVTDRSSANNQATIDVTSSSVKSGTPMLLNRPSARESKLSAVFLIIWIVISCCSYKYQGRGTTTFDHVDHLTCSPDFGHVYTMTSSVFHRTLVTFSPPSSMQSIAMPLCRCE
jgi:hypothetical protein